MNLSSAEMSQLRTELDSLIWKQRSRKEWREDRGERGQKEGGGWGDEGQEKEGGGTKSIECLEQFIIKRRNDDLHLLQYSYHSPCYSNPSL